MTASACLYSSCVPEVSPQRDALASACVYPDATYVDRGFTKPSTNASDLAQKGGGPQPRWQRLRPARSWETALHRPWHSGRIRSRPHPRQTPEGMAAAKSEGRLRGKQNSPEPKGRTTYASTKEACTTTEIAGLFGVDELRSTAPSSEQRQKTAIYRSKSQQCPQIAAPETETA